MPLITPLPTPPSSSDTANFNSRADSFLGALPTLATEVNTVGTNMETQYNYVVANVSTTTNNANQATAAANSAVSAKNSIEVLFLGSKTSNPTTNNSGGALIVGCKYFNTTVGEDRVWTGTNWVSSTAIGGTVASLSVDGTLKLKTNTWHSDSLNNPRLFFGTGGETALRGNYLQFNNSADENVMAVSSNGDLQTRARASLNASNVFLNYHSVTVGNNAGGGSSIGMGITAAGQGAYGTVFADSTHFVAASNTYYNGTDRFSANGYAPKIRLYSTDNRILFQQTDNGVTGDTQVTQNVAEFEVSGNFVVRGRNGFGHVAVSGGGTTNAGLTQYHRPGGERTGYMGYATDNAGSDNVIVADNGHAWRFTGASPLSSVDAITADALPRLSQFASSRSTNGYTKLPNGFIIQWGTVTIGSSGTNITLPITFPTACTSVLASCTTNNLARASIISTSTINVACNPSTPQLCYWIAVGY